MPPTPQEPPRRSGRPFRPGLWLALIGLAGLGLFGLAQLFPGRLSSRDDVLELIRGVLLISIVSAGLASRRFALKETASHVAIWVCLTAFLLIGYTYRAEIAEAALRVRSQIVPSYPAPGAGREMVVSQEADGGFYVTGQVNGQPVRFLVDTGSADIVLSPADAHRVGVNLEALSFDEPTDTANGEGRGAAFTADSLNVGPAQLKDVPMSINQAPLTHSLLGMTFLSRLESFQVRDGRLYLRWAS